MPAFETYGTPDTSFGFGTLNYGDGTKSHKLTLHMATFDSTGTLAVASGPSGSTTTSVFDVWHGLAAILASYYPSSWSFGLLNCFQNPASGSDDPPRLIFSANIGVAGGSSNPIQPARQDTFSWKTALHSTARLVILDNTRQGWNKLVSLAGGSVELSISDYMRNANAFHGRDGSNFTTFLSATSTLNKRLRSHYKLS